MRSTKAKRFVDLDPHDDYAHLLAQAGAVELVKAKVRVTNQHLLAHEVAPADLVANFASVRAKCRGSFEPYQGHVAVVVEICVDDDRLYHPNCRPALRWWHEVVEVPTEGEEVTGEQLALW